MGYTSTGGPKGRGQFNNTPQTTADLNKGLELLATYGNYMGAVSESERDLISGAALYEGLMVYNETSGTLEIYDGSGWSGVYGPTTAYSASPSGLTLGNGTISARYARQGSMVDAVIEVVGGSTTVATSVVGFSLPFTPAGTASVIRHSGSGLFRTGSGIQFQVFARFAPGASVLNLNVPEVVSGFVRSGSNLSQNFPVAGAWANSGLYIHFRYEAAA